MHRSVCICAMIPQLDTRTRLVLILHQLEARKTTNTGRLAARCLTNSRIVIRGRDDSPIPATSEDVEELWAPDSQPLLLFPHDDALPLAAWANSVRPVTLIVPDGTWSQATKARKRIAGLDQVPCVTLPTARATHYRLRRRAGPDRLATLEAVALAMGVLEGASVQRALEHIFAVMVDRTLWTNGRIARAQVTGGIPAGARSHDPLGGVTP